MAKRESIWRAADGTEHPSKQSAAVADAECELRAFVDGTYDIFDGANRGITASVLVSEAAALADALATFIKARAALAKHEAKGEK